MNLVLNCLLLVPMNPLESSKKLAPTLGGSREVTKWVVSTSTASVVSDSRYKDKVDSIVMAFKANALIVKRDVQSTVMPLL